MKRLLIGFGALLAVTTVSANAADLGRRMPVKAAPMVEPVFNWTGFYLGVNGGYGWAKSTHTDVAGLTTGSFNQRGGLIGGTLGYNWQMGGAVLGLEGDLDWARINGSVAGCAFGSCFTNIRGFDTVRGRLGYAAGSWMPYITGGLAVANIQAGQDGVASNDAWRAGWTIGGGVEWMFAPRWSAKAEYLYADFGTGAAVSYTTPAAALVNANERNVNIVRGGINYHFDWGGPVVARY